MDQQNTDLAVLSWKRGQKAVVFLTIDGERRREEFDEPKQAQIFFKNWISTHPVPSDKLIALAHKKI